ncbi:putative disease resistance RPP13-like protein 1 [Cornus florida]|uniref:putative disease resistance RPP13-like protein 1 n=1 Tax=Cornus florida TaxID=4283 RepID=UPI00289ACCD4|nr:putative disease resistance RPP13-like protein 1 [Cornus florida]
MMSKVEKLTERLQGIEIRKKSLGLKASVGGIGSTTAVSERRRETTSLEDKSLVYGREKDKEAILQLLLKEDESVSVSVIPIVGMGGIGKTTLARLVYNDERIKGCFDPKLWVCVSDDYDVVRVTKAILEAFTSDANKLETLNMLQKKLNEKLSGKRFLLVLDDAWNDNYADWDVLRRPFMHGAPGSKIILTTRLRNVAKITSTLCPSQLAYTLNELSKDECLSLFAHHALARPNFDAHPHLKEIGEKIVNKCKGLPLAAKTLGGLLRNESQQRVWENISDSKIWDLPEQQSNILPALRLSYHHLPSHLKQCFAYCAIFPKDYAFDKGELILLWMGVGLLPLSTEKKQMEDFGSEYFDDLLSRSFFQQSSAFESRFVMHDLLNDLTLYIAGDICFMLDKLVGDKQIEIPEGARHLSFLRQRFDGLQRFRPTYKRQHL